MLLGLSMPLEQMASVVENFERVQAIASSVLKFLILDALETLPRVKP